MSQDLINLTATAVTVGFIHVLIGPDHYLPFIALSKSGRWSFSKTMWFTFICGVGHLLGAVALAFIGIRFGLMVNKLAAIESMRGELASGMLIAFGLVYFVWGLRQAFKKRSLGPDAETTVNNFSWILVIIFVLGPCEPLIPILMYPTVGSSLQQTIWASSILGGTTLLTMMGAVAVLYRGVDLLPVNRPQRCTHALAGGAILFCGIAVGFLGL